MPRSPKPASANSAARAASRPARLALAVADFNFDVTHAMRDAALAHAKKRGAPVARVVHVAGSYDLPFAVQFLLERNDVDAVVAIGAIVKGETKHDEVIGHATAHSLQALYLKYKKPVALSITGPGITIEQARARAKSVPEHAVDAAINLVRLARGENAGPTATRTHDARYR